MKLEILATTAMAADSVAAVDVGGVVTAYAGEPLLEAARETVIHQETSPAQIGVAGAPATIAAPSRSIWQTDSYALRLVQRLAYTLRAPGLAALVTGCTW